MASDNPFNKRWTVQYGKQDPFEIAIADVDRMRDYGGARRDHAVAVEAMNVGQAYKYYDGTVERDVTIKRTR